MAAAVPVVAASGVEVGGILVGTTRAGLVGGRVEVTKRGGAGVAVGNSSEETLTQEVNVKMSRKMIQIFFIPKFFRACFVPKG